MSGLNMSGGICPGGICPGWNMSRVENVPSGLRMSQGGVCLCVENVWVENVLVANVGLRMSGRDWAGGIRDTAPLPQCHKILK